MVLEKPLVGAAGALCSLGGPTADLLLVLGLGGMAAGYFVYSRFIAEKIY